MAFDSKQPEQPVEQKHAFRPIGELARRVIDRIQEQRKERGEKPFKEPDGDAHGV